MSSTSSTTSPDDASKNITENIDPAETTRPLSASGDTRPLTMRLPTSDGVATDAVTSADSAPASSEPGTVWSAGTVTGQNQQPQAPRDIRGSTLLWGAFLLLVGGLLIAAGLGLRFDFTTTAIACLAGLGGLLVAAALIPKKRRSSKKP